MNNQTCALAFALTLSSAAAAKDVELSCPVPGHGAFVMTVPGGWKTTCGEQVQSPAAANPRAGPLNGDAFKLLLTAVWLQPEQRAKAEHSLKANVQVVGERTLPQAEEKSVALVELRSLSMHGFIFVLTDKDPGSGFKYLMQGSLAVGELTVPVTFLFRDADAPDKAAALAALKSARHVK
jgi:hypothetical protein